MLHPSESEAPNLKASPNHQVWHVYRGVKLYPQPVPAMDVYWYLTGNNSEVHHLVCVHTIWLWITLPMLYVSIQFGFGSLSP